MKRKLTQRLIDAMPTPDRGELWYYDTEVTGLGVRAQHKWRAEERARELHGHDRG